MMGEVGDGRIYVLVLEKSFAYILEITIIILLVHIAEYARSRSCRHMWRMCPYIRTFERASQERRPGETSCLPSVPFSNTRSYVESKRMASDWATWVWGKENVPLGGMEGLSKLSSRL